MKTSFQDSRKKFGQRAETLAAEFLANQGLKILERNLRVRTGEIDIVAMDHATLVIVEVRFRTRKNQVDPAASITPKKQKKIVQNAMCYIQKKQLHDLMVRFDVVTVSGPEEYLEWYPNAFWANR